MKEIWKDITEFEGLYQVSNLGRIKRLGNTPKCKKGRVLKSYRDEKNNKYSAVRLSKRGKVCQREVHRVVAREFLGCCPEGFQVNHKNSNKEINHATNLEYITPLENIRHSQKAGTFVKRKLTKEDVMIIRSSKKTPNELAKKYGCSIVNIRNVLKRRCFKWV